VALACQALADNPSAPVDKSDPNTPAASPASPANAGQAKPATPADANKPATDDDAVARARDKRLQAMGYKPVKRDGVTMYCRKEAVIGTRFSHMLCSTAENLQRTAENAQQETDRMVRRSLSQVPSN
jgi:hypothetical protein